MAIQKAYTIWRQLCMPLLLALLLVVGATVSAAPIRPRVLFISSYAYDYSIVRAQISGVREIFKEDVTVNYEFMDTHHFPTHEIYSRFASMLSYKLAHTPPYQAVMLGDDAALDFALQYRQELFKDMPLVFHGINDLDRAKRAAQDPRITGLAELFSIQGTIDAALHLMPNATRVIAIIEGSLTGSGLRQLFYSHKADFPQLEFSEINVSEFPPDQLRQRLRSLTMKDIALYLNFGGHRFSLHEGAILCNEEAGTPVFHFMPDCIGHGFIGGKVFSHKDSGRIAATMALRIINGTPPSQIPFINDLPTHYLFDYALLQKWHLDSTRLPSGSELIGFQPSFFQKYRLVLLPAGGIIALLLLVALILWYNNFRQHRLAARLTAKHQQLQHRVRHDSLTGLRSRTTFVADMAALLKNKTPCALVAVDLDNFKPINDTWGHQCGDAVLREAARRLKKVDPNICTAYRQGGDEFFLILRTTDVAVIDAMMQRLLADFALPFNIEEQSLSLGLSIGISIAPQDSRRTRDLITFADVAMYYVKRHGKNNWQYYSALRNSSLMEGFLSRDETQERERERERERENSYGKAESTYVLKAIFVLIAAGSIPPYCFSSLCCSNKATCTFHQLVCV